MEASEEGRSVDGEVSPTWYTDGNSRSLPWRHARRGSNDHIQLDNLAPEDGSETLQVAGVPVPRHQAAGRNPGGSCSQSRAAYVAPGRTRSLEWTLRAGGAPADT